MTWKDGATYQGHWVKGRASGYGKFIYPNGDHYIGEWLHDKANGWGIMIKISEENPLLESMIM